MRKIVQTVYSSFIYPIGFYAFQSVFFATIYSNSSYFISGFGAGNIYLSCIVSPSCIVLSIILKQFILVHIFTPFSILSYYALYNIMFCSFLVYTDFVSSIYIYLSIYKKTRLVDDGQSQYNSLEFR